MPLIRLPYGDATFDSDDLVEYIRQSGRDYIVQGQVICTRENHPKPSSLDVWLRDNYSKKPDVKQASNDVMEALVSTGDFEEGKFICPDSETNTRCKGLRIVQTEK